MGGYAPDQIKKTKGGAAPPTIVGDGCDLAFQTDLVGVQSRISGGLNKNDELVISLHVQGSIRSVVCETKAGAVVGTLAAFRGLSRLIGCLEQGVGYVAVVEAASFSRCSVKVFRR
ncbi:hypothetical protein [Methylosinus sp. LW3]|uniref:hypothetical protein n=1 Tax=Methylosinus sp. LW3 TaxID=107635 RepID=UPI0004646B86|nr:hypothetical protein [Methylosinus sp. LW3]